MISVSSRRTVSARKRLYPRATNSFDTAIQLSLLYRFREIVRHSYEEQIVAQFTKIHTRDLKVVCNELEQFYGEVRVDISGRFEWEAKTSFLGPNAVVQSACSAFMCLELTPREQVIVLASTDTARVKSKTGIASVEPGCGAALLPIGARCEMRTDAGAQLIALRIEQEFLRRQLFVLTGVNIEQPIEFALSMRTGLWRWCGHCGTLSLSC